MHVSDYKDQGPKLDIREYLDGHTKGWGIIRDWKGSVKTRFTFEIDGTWDGNKGELKEVFIYSDGTEEKRVWDITFHDDTSFTGITDDVVGKAEGKQMGNTMNWQYTWKVKRSEGKTINIDMDDWLFLIDDKTLINEIILRKWGIKVGRISIGFIKS